MTRNTRFAMAAIRGLIAVPILLLGSVCAWGQSAQEASYVGEKICLTCHSQ